MRSVANTAVMFVLMVLTGWVASTRGLPLPPLQVIPCTLPAFGK